MKRKLFGSIAALVVAGGLFTACTSTSQPSAIARDQHSSASVLNQMEQAQPAPQFKYSQIRQTLITAETVEAQGVQTTSFFFNMGVQDPIQACPSIGLPVAATDEVTNPQQVVNAYSQGVSSAVINQIDPNGIYAGDTSGTYVVCVSPSGQNYLNYWEGFVQTVSGPAVWDANSHSVRLTGPSTATIKKAP